MKMNVDNLRELVEKSSKDNQTYSMLMVNVDCLMKERIKLVGNNLRNILNRPKQEVDKKGVLESVQNINKISSKLGCDFHIEEDWDTIEAFLRMSILEDISKEFEKQTY